VLPPSSCRPSSPAPSLDYVFHRQRQPECLTVGVEGAHERVNYLHDPPLGYSYGTDLAKRYNRITASGLAVPRVELRRRPGEEAADADALDAVSRRHRFDHDTCACWG